MGRPWRFLINGQEDLHKQFKLMSVIKGVSIEKLAIQAIKEFIAKEQIKGA